MEDAATAEISRAQVWQWIRHPRGVLSDGRKVTKELFRSLLQEELGKIQSWIGQERYKQGKYGQAAELFDRLTTSDQFTEFLTLPGYEQLDYQFLAKGSPFKKIENRTKLETNKCKGTK
jgi:malate synthase